MVVGSEDDAGTAVRAGGYPGTVNREQHKKHEQGDHHDRLDVHTQHVRVLRLVLFAILLRLPHLIQTEYYVSMLIRRFVSLRVACVKSYHARPKVERDATFYRQREVVQTDGSIC